jgi:hypothetical protein
VTKYYKSVVYVGGDSVKSDQTLILSQFNNINGIDFDCKIIFRADIDNNVIKLKLSETNNISCMITTVKYFT